MARDAPLAMPTRLVHVMPPCALYPSSQRIVHRSHDPRRDADHQRARGDVHPFGEQRPGPDHRPRPHSDTVQHDRPHPNERLVLDRAAVEDRPMPHTYPSTDRARHSFVDVDHAEILDVGLVTDRDRRHVPADDRMVPDTRVPPKGNVADHDRAGGDERRRMDHEAGWWSVSDRARLRRSCVSTPPPARRSSAPAGTASVWPSGRPAGQSAGRSCPQE